MVDTYMSLLPPPGSRFIRPINFQHHVAVQNVHLCTQSMVTHLNAGSQYGSNSSILGQIPQLKLPPLNFGPFSPQPNKISIFPKFGSKNFQNFCPLLPL